jgi:hypothetical protein
LKILGTKLEMELNNDSKHMPFQVQISYTTLTGMLCLLGKSEKILCVCNISILGMKCMRVITKTKEITRNAEEAQQDIDVAVFGMHCNAKQVRSFLSFYSLLLLLLLLLFWKKFSLTEM